MQLFVDDLTVIDFSYLCKQRGIVGESWIVDVLLDGSLNEMSMVLDFAVVKKQIKAIIDDAVDHKLLLPMQEQAVTLAESPYNDGHQTVDFVSDIASYYLQSPACAFAAIDCLTITVPAVIEHLKAIILAQLPNNVEGLTLVLRPENIPTDYYHYTHGLKLHDGNCQRIAHGHRSKIQILVDDKRDANLEAAWCKRWQDIYIASEADRISVDDIQLSAQAMKDLTPDHQYFSYHAPQGRFDIAVDTKILDVVDCDSTVELLADFILRQVKAEHPELANNTIKVIAYEGVAKGAIVHG
ncbi:6-carboxytetrahydropterin synthase [Colwellia sp. 4_MG-2023]|uniref:6-carboxytetrahydropterin synthase n=1 Tax=unclassified Colwellia TaxID=196834 RepID=UPI001C0A4CB7|nr:MULTISPECIES: 6-carboxytetrahydropterin synthase [unclassified Colwellia]MBU2926012.1 6-carboxytetrahydropterin synthase [Colwellia sp. C2M11]MDO6507719.1 6-carboxytetrahydropterin synthase [Colwellia sp. 5_MG-2023]MDO6556321.1 6-carboxytetrahydropterin synthase [Colwellia sp. 4_MG-2023]MDO6653152.1 6-carboxytetrahydropterin synthase [Colwellia sp. 3_MG-2023]MDO6666095.1 6-carboxytetrahydropterin synthase [Colwellia sp. 2_MG-2023]